MCSMHIFSHCVEYCIYSCFAGSVITSNILASQAHYLGLIPVVRHEKWFVVTF